MKKWLAAAFAAIALALVLHAPASATNRVDWYYSQQPPSDWMTLAQLDTYESIGQLFWDAIGRSSNGQIFTNLKVAADSGLYVDVQPSDGNYGSLYQVGPVDTAPYPQPTDPDGNWPANAKEIYHQGMLLAATSAIGPLNPAPTGGDSYAYTIECQTQTVDANSQTFNLVSQTNVTTPTTGYRDRLDNVVCQSTAASAESASPTPPPADSGWLSVGSVSVANGTSTITSGMITQGTPFGGFALSGGDIAYLNQVQSWTAAQTYGDPSTFEALVEFANSSPTFGNYPEIAGDAQTDPGFLFNVATGSAGVRFETDNALNGAQITASGGLVGTSLNIKGATFDGTTLTATASPGPLRLNSSGSGGVGVDYNNGDTTGLKVYDGSTGNYVNVQPSTGVTFNISPAPSTSPNAYGPYVATINQLTIPVSASASPGQCLTLNASNQVVTAGGACGLSSGTISSVSGSGNITASTVAGAVTVGITPNPTFSGPVTVASATTAGALCFGSDSNSCFTRASATLGLTSGIGLSIPSGVTSGSSYYYPTYAVVNGNLTASSLTVSPVPSPTACPSAMLGVTSAGVVQSENGCAVISVTASGNLSSSGGTTPAITMTAAPSLTALTLTGLTDSNCVGTSAADLLVSNTNCVASITATGNLSVTTGPTPAVSMTAGPSFTTVTTTGLATLNSASITGASGLIFPAPATTPAPTSQVGIYNDLGATNGMEFNVPTSSTNGWRFMVDGSSVASVSNAGLLTAAYLATTGSSTSTVHGDGTSAPALFIGAAGSNTWAFKIGSGVAGGDFSDLGAATGSSVASVAGQALYVDWNDSTNVLTVDDVGDEGIAGSFHVTSSNALFIGTNSFAVNSGTSVAGVTSSVLNINDGTNTTGNQYLAMDGAGNEGILGNYFAASSRAEKRDISPIPFDALSMVERTNWIQWCYKANKACNIHTPGDATFGYVAEDTSAYLAGPKHDHTSAQNLAAVDAAAIKELAAKVNAGTPAGVDALRTQVDVLYGLVGLLFVLWLSTWFILWRAYRA